MLAVAEMDMILRDFDEAIRVNLTFLDNSARQRNTQTWPEAPPFAAQRGLRQVSSGKSDCIEASDA